MGIGILIFQLGVFFSLRISVTLGVNYGVLSLPYNIIFPISRDSWIAGITLVFNFQLSSIVSFSFIALDSIFCVKIFGVL